MLGWWRRRAQTPRSGISWHRAAGRPQPPGCRGEGSGCPPPPQDAAPTGVHFGGCQGSEPPHAPQPPQLLVGDPEGELPGRQAGVGRHKPAGGVAPGERGARRAGGRAGRCADEGPAAGRAGRCADEGPAAGRAINSQPDRESARLTASQRHYRPDQDMTPATPTSQAAGASRGAAHTPAPPPHISQPATPQPHPPPPHPTHPLTPCTAPASPPPAGSSGSSRLTPSRADAVGPGSSPGSSPRQRECSPPRPPGRCRGC